MTISSSLNRAYDVSVVVKPATQHPRQWTRFQRRKAIVRLFLRWSQWNANWRHK